MDERTELNELRKFYEKLKMQSPDSVAISIRSPDDKIKRKTPTEEEKWLADMVRVPTLRRLDRTLAFANSRLFKRKFLGGQRFTKNRYMDLKLFDKWSASVLTQVLKENAYGSTWAESDKLKNHIRKIASERRKNHMASIKNTGKPLALKHQNASDALLDDHPRGRRETFLVSPKKKKRSRRQLHFSDDAVCEQGSQRSSSSEERPVLLDKKTRHPSARPVSSPQQRTEKSAFSSYKEKSKRTFTLKAVKPEPACAPSRLKAVKPEPVRVHSRLKAVKPEPDRPRKHRRLRRVCDDSSDDDDDLSCSSRLGRMKGGCRPTPGFADRPTWGDVLAQEEAEIIDLCGTTSEEEESFAKEDDAHESRAERRTRRLNPEAGKQSVAPIGHCPDCKSPLTIDTAFPASTKTKDGATLRCAGCWDVRKSNLMKVAKTKVAKTKVAKKGESGKSAATSKVKKPAKVMCHKCGGDHLGKNCHLTKGSDVEVLYEGQWWDAKILLVHKPKSKGYKVQYYDDEGCVQEFVPAKNIRYLHCLISPLMSHRLHTYDTPSSHYYSPPPLGARKRRRIKMASLQGSWESCV